MTTEQRIQHLGIIRSFGERLNRAPQSPGALQMRVSRDLLFSTPPERTAVSPAGAGDFVLRGQAREM